MHTIKQSFLMSRSYVLWPNRSRMVCTATDSQEYEERKYN